MQRWEDKIGRTGEILSVQTEAQSQAVSHLSDQHFRPRVTRGDAAHVPTSTRCI